MADSDLARSSLLAAALNSFVAILLRVLTFVSNAFIIRYVAKDTLGIINVRLLLFSDTVLFISREAFRKACLGRSPEGSWSKTINLIWFSLPVSIVASFSLGYIWKYVLEMPDTEDATVQYRTAVNLMSLGAIVEVCAEPFFIFGQVHKFVKFRSAVDFIHLATRTFLMVIVVMYYPNWSIILFGYAHLAATILLLFLNIFFYFFVINISSQRSIIGFKSLFQFLPNPYGPIDQDQFQLVRAFFGQGIVKQLLTEGEKYLFTGLELMTFAQQGIYDAVGNLGSLAARLVFSKIEESAYFYFSQTISRDASRENQDNEASAMRHLTQLLRLMSLLGLVICGFGFSYSHLLLFMYGGSSFSDGLGVQLMRGHCVFVMFMAVNGISECFSFAVMSRAQVDSYNYKLGLLSLAFLAMAWAFSKALGPVGFIVANCFNFGFRIAHNFYVIQKRRDDMRLAVKNPVTSFIPSKRTLAVILISAVVCQLSECFLYDPNNFARIILHLIFGGMCFLFTVAVIILEEPLLRRYVRRVVLRKDD